MSNNLYRVYWCVKKDPSKNGVGQPTSQSIAEALVEQKNKQYPELHHWAASTKKE